MIVNKLRNALTLIIYGTSILGYTIILGCKALAISPTIPSQASWGLVRYNNNYTVTRPL
jgi:hypothetical protein